MGAASVFSVSKMESYYRRNLRAWSMESKRLTDYGGPGFGHIINTASMQDWCKAQEMWPIQQPSMPWWVFQITADRSCTGGSTCECDMPWRCSYAYFGRGGRYGKMLIEIPLNNYVVCWKDSDRCSQYICRKGANSVAKNKAIIILPHGGDCSGG